MHTTKLARIVRPITGVNSRALHAGSVVTVLGSFVNNEGKKTLTVELQEKNSKYPPNIFTILEEYVEYIEEAAEIVEQSKTIYQRAKELVLKVWASLKNLFTSNK